MEREPVNPDQNTDNTISNPVEGIGENTTQEATDNIVENTVEESADNIEETETDPASEGVEEKTPEKKPGVVITLLKVAAYIGSNMLWLTLWVVIFALGTAFFILSQIPESDMALLKQNSSFTNNFTTAITRQVMVLNHFRLAANSSFLVFLFLFFWFRKQSFFERAKLKMCSPLFLLSGALFGVGVRLVVDGIGHFVPIVSGSTGSSLNSFYTLLVGPDPYSGLNLVVLILATGIITPLAEEVLFRGIALDHLKRIWPVTISIIVISVLFGLVHSPIVFSLLMCIWSFLLCYSTDRSGSTLPSLINHVVFNILSIVFCAVQFQVTREWSLLFLILGSLFLIGGFASFFAAKRK